MEEIKKIIWNWNNTDMLKKKPMKDGDKMKVNPINNAGKPIKREQ